MKRAKAAEGSASERDELAAQLANLEDELALATQAHGDAETALASTREQIAGLQSERTVLQQQLATLEAATHQAAAQSARERGQLAIALLSAKAAQDAAEAQLVDADGTIEELTAESSRLAQEVARLAEQEATLAAQLASEREALGAEIDQRQRELAEAQAELQIAREQSAGLTAALDQLRRQTYWLAQVADYHRGYAGTMREVEVTAEQEQKAQMLTKWLTVMLDREVAVPDLSDAGMTFIGGRLFFINGWPVGQIAYHDRDGRLFGFCLKRNPTGTEQAPTRSRIDDLYLVDWQTPDYQYVLIGFADFAEIEPLAERLSRTDGDET